MVEKDRDDARRKGDNMNDEGRRPWTTAKKGDEEGRKS